MTEDFPLPPDEPVPVIQRDLEAKRTVPSPRKAPTIRSGRGSIFGKSSIPSVYWADDDPTPLNGDEYTFYRENTPPPSSDEKGGAAGAGAGAGAFAGAGADAHWQHGGFAPADQDTEGRARGPPGQQQQQRRCCGLRLWVFLLLVGMVLLVVLGVGVGVGVGVGQQKQQQQKADQDGFSATASSHTTPTSAPSALIPDVPTHTPTSSPTAASTSTATSTPETTTTTKTTTTSSSSSPSSFTSPPAPTATSGPAAICPDANNTVYSVAGSDKKFLRVCGVDYSGAGEAIDILNTPAATMGECMETCAKTAQCTGVSWGNVVAGDGQTELLCWLKRGLQTSHRAGNWNFAILL